MCPICKSNVARTYTHALSKDHKKKLMAVMKAKKLANYYQLFN
jgi:hypothetical protein